FALIFPGARQATRASFICLVSSLSILGFSVDEASALDPQPYTLAIADSGSGELNGVLSASSQLSSLRVSAPTAPFGLIERARADIARFQTALESFGYYQNHVSITIAGTALADPGLPAVLDKSAGPVPVNVSIEKGPLYHLGTIVLKGEVPQSGRAMLG